MWIQIRFIKYDTWFVTDLCIIATLYVGNWKRYITSITNLKQSGEEVKSDYEADLSAREIKPSRSGLNSIQWKRTSPTQAQSYTYENSGCVRTTGTVASQVRAAGYATCLDSPLRTSGTAAADHEQGWKELKAKLETMEEGGRAQMLEEGGRPAADGTDNSSGKEASLSSSLSSQVFFLSFKILFKRW